MQGNILKAAAISRHSDEGGFAIEAARKLGVDEGLLACRRRCSVAGPCGGRTSLGSQCAWLGPGSRAGWDDKDNEAQGYEQRVASASAKSRCQNPPRWQGFSSFRDTLHCSTLPVHAAFLQPPALITHVRRSG